MSAPTYYKFLDSRDIDKVLRDGTLKLSSLKFFRDMEVDDPWIADRLEGATELTTPSQFTVTTGSTELDQLNRANIGLGMFKQFANVSGGQINMGGVRFVHQVPEMYVYSYACGDIDGLTKAMCRDARKPYDACVSIVDPMELLNVIMEKGQDQITKTTAASIFKNKTLGPVTYDTVTQDIRTGPTIPPSPFTKATQFAPQREHRLLFDPSSKGLPETIIIQIPYPEKHFKEVFRSFKP